MRTKIKSILHAKETSSLIGKTVTVSGWVRTVRDQKAFAFIELNDGSTLSNLQIVADSSLPDYSSALSQLTTGASMSATGKLVESLGKNQSLELKADTIRVIGLCSAEKYPLQKKDTRLNI